MTGSRIRKFSTDDATMSFPAYDPGVDKIGLTSSEGKLASLRKNLSACKEKYNDSGVILEHYIKNLKGLNPILVPGVKMFLTRTRSSLFLLSDTSPESLYEISKGFMAIDFKKKCILENEKTGKFLYLLHVSSEDVRVVRSVAAKLNPQQPVAKEPTVDTLAIREGASFELEKFKGKMKTGDMVSGTINGLTLAEFVDKIADVLTFDDENGTSHYFIVDEQYKRFRLYVNQQPFEPQSYKSTTTFRFNADYCVLCEEN